MRAPTAGRPAWVLAGVSTGTAVAVVAGAVATSEVPSLAAGLGGGGVLLLCASLALGAHGGVVWALACLLGAWTLALAGADDSLRPSVALAAAGCLVTAETAWWSLETTVRRPRARLPSGLVGRRAIELAGWGLGTVAAGVAVLWLATAVAGGGFGAEAVGVAAVLALLSLTVVVGGRAVGRER